jgi:hypothetical protein
MQVLVFKIRTDLSKGHQEAVHPCKPLVLTRQSIFKVILKSLQVTIKAIKEKFLLRINWFFKSDLDKPN